ncbi:MAG: glycoside hydrolase family 2 TIM barrel-domain containing protein [Flavobacteriales bacterium]
MKNFFVLILLCLNLTTLAQPAVVKVVQQSGQWVLLKDSSPYYIKGVGGQVHMDKAVQIGANTMRTWGAENAREVLDQAQKEGLMVMMGLWVQHERHGFDYNNAARVKAQLEGFRSVVNELKDHPALLMWGVGNEVDLFYTNTNVWYAVEDIAKMIKEIDSNHPTCTVTAGLDKEEVRLIKERAPSIDIYGVNTYGDIGNVKENIRTWGWTGPYMITEWGPNGHWEVEKTNWNAPIEQSSSEKADSYEQRYKNYIDADKTMCIGSFVFLWGQKQETTSTWYGLFSERGESGEPIDRLEKIWTGKTPVNSAPKIGKLTINQLTKKENVLVYAEEKYDCTLECSDVDQDNLNVEWLIIPESTDIKAGGDAEAAPLPLHGVFSKRKTNEAQFRAPTTPGSYRLFVFIRDGHGHYAYDNLPFKVMPRTEAMGPGRAISFKKMSMNE